MQRYPLEDFKRCDLCHLPLFNGRHVSHPAVVRNAPLEQRGKGRAVAVELAQGAVREGAERAEKGGRRSTALPFTDSEKNQEGRGAFLPPFRCIVARRAHSACHTATLAPTEGHTTQREYRALYIFSGDSRQSTTWCTCEKQTDSGK